MTLATQRSTWGKKFSLAAPVLAVGLLAASPSSAAGLGGAVTLGDINTSAASNIIEIAGHKRGRGWRGRGRGRGARRGRRFDNYAHRRKRSRRKRRNAAIGIGLGLLGAAILADRHYKRDRYAPAYGYSGGGGYRAAKRRCARVYGEDYSWRTDLVYNSYGEGRVCKFVRRLD